LKHRL